VIAERGQRTTAGHGRQKINVVIAQGAPTFLCEGAATIQSGLQSSCTGARARVCVCVRVRVRVHVRVRVCACVGVCVGVYVRARVRVCMRFQVFFQALRACVMLARDAAAGVMTSSRVAACSQVVKREDVVLTTLTHLILPVTELPLQTTRSTRTANQPIEWPDRHSQHNISTTLAPNSWMCVSLITFEPAWVAVCECTQAASTVGQRASVARINIAQFHVFSEQRNNQRRKTNCSGRCWSARVALGQVVQSMRHRNKVFLFTFFLRARMTHHTSTCCHVALLPSLRRAMHRRAEHVNLHTISARMWRSRQCLREMGADTRAHREMAWACLQ
jgi:hypothetical protein